MSALRSALPVPSFCPSSSSLSVDKAPEAATTMWNDEDNNPYGAFEHNESHFSDSLHSASISPTLIDREASPSPSAHYSDDAPDYVTNEPDLSDEDGPEYGAQSAPGYRRKSVYDSRIEQILYENLDMPILITDAGKNHEGGGSFIVYTIRTGVCSHRQPYCERRITADGYAVIGYRSPTAILGIRFSSTDTGQPSSDSHHSSDSREAYDGGLCG